MNIIEYFLSFFQGKPQTRDNIEEKIRDVEGRKAAVQLRLARENEKPDPDALKVDRYEREIAVWEGLLEKLQRQLQEAE